MSSMMLPASRMNDWISPPSTLWLTGLSGAGKTTLAQALVMAFAEASVPVHVLDGDAVRQDLCRDLGFSREDRRENIRRVAQRSRALNDAGQWVIAALISPYREDREMARANIGAACFVEVHVATPLSVCESRDPKGLYAKARAGAIASFTGIDAPYETPLAPDLRLDTTERTLPGCVTSIMTVLARRASQIVDANAEHVINLRGNA